MNARFGILLVITGTTFLVMHWLGPVGPLAILGGATLVIRRIDVRRDSRDSGFHSTLHELARVDAPRNAA